MHARIWISTLVAATLAACAPAGDTPQPSAPAPVPVPSKSTYVYVSPSQLWHGKVNELCAPAATKIAKLTKPGERLEVLIGWIGDVERLEIPSGVNYAPEFVADLREFKKSAQIYSLMLEGDEVTTYGGNGKTPMQVFEEDLATLREAITKYARELDMPACLNLF